MNITIFTDRITPRIQYITDFICRQLLGVGLELTDQPDYFKQAKGARISYTHRPWEGVDLWMPQHTLLVEATIQQQHIEVFQKNDLPIFFHYDHPKAMLSFDLFAMAFYLISRYEEYLSYQSDTHGRFPSTASLAAQHGFLHLPLIDLLVQQLVRSIQQFYPNFEVTSPPYRFTPTYDIDMAWSYLHKGWQRNLGAAARELLRGQWASLSQRLQVLQKKIPDPFDQFEYMDQLNEQFQLRPIYFYLLGTRGSFDKNITPSQPAMQALIRQLHTRYSSGLHPSYYSNQHFDVLLKEKQCLETILKTPVHKSRQHFVRLHLPTTYRNLLKTGITADFSMGYADQLGFRASTSVPFYWYNLEQESPTKLLIYPFQLMDVTLQQYLQLAPEEALAAAIPIIDQVQQNGGNLIYVWHNSSLTDQGSWKNWREVYVQLLKYATKGEP